MFMRNKDYGKLMYLIDCAKSIDAMMPEFMVTSCNYSLDKGNRPPFELQTSKLKKLCHDLNLAIDDFHNSVVELVNEP